MGTIINIINNLIMNKVMRAGSVATLLAAANATDVKLPLIEDYAVNYHSEDTGRNDGSEYIKISLEHENARTESFASF